MTSLLAGTILFLAPIAVQGGETKPFKAWQVSAADDSGNFIGEGRCNVGGKFTSVALVSSVNVQFPFVEVIERQIWTMANGDQLWFENVGTINLLGSPRVLDWDVTIVGGTGRFENVTGSARGSGTESPVNAFLRYEGVISTVGAAK